MISVRKIYLVCLLAISSVLAGKSQESPFVSQYFDFQTFYNPAAAGMDKTLKIAIDGRLDSVGIESYPKSVIAIGEAGIDLSDWRFGAGINFERGKSKERSPMAAGLMLSAGYRAGGGLVSIGISGGILRDRIYTEAISGGENGDDEKDDGEKMATDDARDDRARSKVSMFDMGAGVYYRYKGLWLSASVKHLLNPKFRYRKTGFVEDESNPFAEVMIEAAPRTFYFGGGYNIILKRSLLDMEPSFIVSTSSLNTQYQATARFKYRKLIQLGIGCRSEKIGTIFAGIEYGGFHLQYSYDHGFGKGEEGYKMRGHEVMLWYSIDLDLNKKKKYGQKSVRIL